MIKRMLVAVDETPASRVALDLAIAIAKQRSAVITGVGVVDRPWATAPQAVPIGGSAYKVHRNQVVLDELRHEVEAILGQERTVQASIFDVFAEHEIGRELKAMSDWLDAHGALLGLVAADLRREGVKETGRQGLPAEAVLRCALLKQYRQLSYEELTFHLEDSASFRAFARLPWPWRPKK